MAREIMERVGSEVRVLNATKLPFIGDTSTKTDKEDAMKRAHLVEEQKDEQLPIVPLPSEQELDGREMRNRTRPSNTLHALFVHQGHTTIVRKNLATAAKRQEVVKLLTGLEREEAVWILTYLTLHEQRIKELKARIQREAKNDAGMQNVQMIPGVGPVVAYALSAHGGTAVASVRGRR